MNEKLDKKTQALLLEALERAKADGKKMQEKERIAYGELSIFHVVFMMH